MSKGWFVIPGVQDGDRTLARQLIGLGRLLERVAGKVVLDLGCAEGLISQQCLNSGAREVLGIDCNAEALKRADRLGLDPHRARFVMSDLNNPPTADDLACCHADIVLMLAVAHKMHDPGKFLREWSQFARKLLVVRLPAGSNGRIASKHEGARCNVNKVLGQCGFRLEEVHAGPLKELVQYWVRT